APRRDAELRVDVARVRADGLDPDRELLRDLLVAEAPLEQLEDVRLARREQLGRRKAELLLVLVGGRGGGPGQHVHASGGEVDRVDDVASLRLLRDAGGGAEGEHLVALRRRRPVGEQHDARLGVALVQLVDHGRLRERAEVQEDDRRVVRVEHALELIELDVARRKPQVGVLEDQLAEADRDQILETGRDDGDRGGHWVRAVFWGEAGGGCLPPNLTLTLPRRAPFQSSEYHPKFTRGGGRGIRRHREPFPYLREPAEANPDLFSSSQRA